MKNNARRRKKDFSLTLEEFKDFCLETDYIAKKGKKKKSLTIDRIDPTKGYSRDNIQVLSLSENSSKSDSCPF